MSATLWDERRGAAAGSTYPNYGAWYAAVVAGTIPRRDVAGEALEDVGGELCSSCNILAAQLALEVAA